MKGDRRGIAADQGGHLELGLGPRSVALGVERLVAGIFFAFSTFIMRALGRLRPAEGVAAMQAINVISEGWRNAFGT